MTTGQFSSRGVVHTREQLESLPAGTTLVDKWGDPLVKVNSCCFAIVNTDHTAPGLPSGPEPWRYYDLAEVCGEMTDVSWLPMTIHQIPDRPAPVPPAPTRRENDGLSVRARGRLEQAVVIADGRITYHRPGTGTPGEVSVRIEAAGAGQRSDLTGPAAVELRRAFAGDVALELCNHEKSLPGTDAQAAEILGLDLEVWERSRHAIELELAAVAGQRPALRPTGSTARAEERTSAALPSDIGVSGGVAR